MLPQSQVPVVLSTAATALIAALSWPAATALVSHFTTTTTKLVSADELYEDEDGKATHQSMAAFRPKLPKLVVATTTSIGFVLSIALAVLSTTTPPGENPPLLANWLNASQWFLLALQALATILHRDSTRSYTLGLNACIACLIHLSMLLVEDRILLEADPEAHVFGSPVAVGFRIALLPVTLIAGIADISLPRRPDVYRNGYLIDGNKSRSFLNRITFTWLGAVLTVARTKNNLDMDDLPRMDHTARSKELTDFWNETDHPRKLWFETFLVHKWAFLSQWFLALLQAFTNFAPQFALFHILRNLEARDRGVPINLDAWIWVGALFIFTLAGAWIEAWLFWVCWSDIAIPIRAQYSSLIFQKAMRRKDVKGVSKKDSKDAKDGEPANEADPAAKKEVEEEEADPKSRQSTVNLIGVDAKRVSDFCSFNYHFPGSFFKLVISFGFLLQLIGWQSLLAGFLAMALTTPLNIFFTKRYSDAQDRLMKIRDVKMGVVTEALQGIRQIKFSALEDNWHGKIGAVRAKELSELWAVFISDTFLLFCWITSPIALAAASLATYALIFGHLSPSVAFTSIGIFGSLDIVLSVIPELTTDLIDAWVSVERIEKYLRAPEISKHVLNDAPTVSFDNASIAWPSDEEKEDGDLRYVLRDLNISFPDKELSVVSGKTGTGKSLLLAAILGEVDVLAGKIFVPRSVPSLQRYDHKATKDNWIIPSAIAFVAQIPWIENATIKDNILFGLPCDDDRYAKVIEVCALRKDLEMLSDGEDTEIGANGINLSGGQRWRVTFARALYSRAGILVLDDIFSAVDAHVGRHIFEKGLTGELGAGRTRILVTHHVALCKPRTKYLVELGEGTVENAGLVSELEEDGTLQKIISHEADEVLDEQEVEDLTAVNSEESSDGGSGDILAKIDSKKPTPKKFVEDERKEKGRVKTAVYLNYMKATGGVPFWLFVFLVYGSMQVITQGRTWWLRIWTENYEDVSSNLVSHINNNFIVQDYIPRPMYNLTSNSTTPSESSEHLGYYLGIYVTLSVAGAIIGTLRYFTIYVGSIRASRKLFDKLSWTILRTPLRWIDTVPLGRILNRFTADITVVDSRLANDIGFGGHDIFRLCGVIIAGIFVSPYIILLSVILLTICVLIAQQYMPGGREAKRLESNAKSPVFEQFGSALTGVGTIRAFDKSEVYISRIYKRIDDHSVTFWHLWGFNRWMGLRMALVGAFFAAVVAGLIISTPSIDASLAGFALAYALDYTAAVIWTIRHYTSVELDMNAAERIIEYSELPTEAQDGIDPPAGWPSEGRLEVNDLVVSYAPDLPPVLKGLTFTVQRNERIGVVGRTGAGKSSLTLAIFRFLEASQGSIYIDGLDVSKIKLHALRSRLAIIPQDPVLFSGTVRSNLDAFDEHTDNELRDALERVHLTSSSSFSNTPGEATPTGARTPNPNASINDNINIFRSLSSPISEGGLNLSQGQRQLLCLGRAIVSRPKIMVLDEATSAVDMATDALIQRSIREEFGDSTLLVIAHRLSTIADFDKILVLDDGQVREFGTPRELYEMDGADKGVFRGMVEESGERDKLIDLIYGR